MAWDYPKILRFLFGLLFIVAGVLIYLELFAIYTVEMLTITQMSYVSALGSILGGVALWFCFGRRKERKHGTRRREKDLAEETFLPK